MSTEEISIKSREQETITGGAPLAQRRELICSLCGYGIVRCKGPNRCPMCGGNAWGDPPLRIRRA
jgi:rubrerythrin